MSTVLRNPATSSVSRYFSLKKKKREKEKRATTKRLRTARELGNSLRKSGRQWRVREGEKSRVCDRGGGKKRKGEEKERRKAAGRMADNAEVQDGESRSLSAAAV